MNGVHIIGALLNASADLLDLVPTAQIKAGSLPQGVALPAVAANLVSGVYLNPLSTDAVRRVRDRVRVTALARSYSQKVTVLQLIRSACADKQGDFGDLTQAVVLLDNDGPDMEDEQASIYMQTHDFLVTYNRPA